MDQFYELVMLYLVHYAHHVTFPELVYPLIIKCKKFTKVCKVQNFVKVIRGLLEKVQENVNLIEERRQKTGLNVKDTKQMVKEKKKNFSVEINFYLINRIIGLNKVVNNQHQVHLLFILNDINHYDNVKF
jgi:hypothetical protein